MSKSDTTFTITIRATSVVIDHGEEAMYLLEPLIDSLTYEDEYVEETKTLGYMYYKENDELYIHKGVDINYLKRLLIYTKIRYDLGCKPKQMSFEYEVIVPPRNDDQIDVIDFISGQGYHSNNIDESQLFLVKSTGFGKTFCSGVGICKYGMKALIVMHRNTLRTQWLNSLYNMSGLSDQYVHEIETSEEFEKIAHNKHEFDYDVYLLTHATFRAGIKRIGDLNLIMNIPKNLGIGIKIIDEAHLEFRDTIMMDFCFNIKRNLYITATDGRSQKDENSIFKHVFSNVLYYKPSAMLTINLPKKWVEYYAVEVNTNCKPNMYKYKVNGGRGMNPASYGKWVIQYDKKKTHFKCCKDIVKEFYNRDQYSKILLFMPLIELCEECAYFLKIQLDKDTDFNYDLDIRTINSKNSPKDNEYAKSADIIVTTIGSCGTGTDIPGITGIISCSPFVSKINAQQIFGRIRYCGKICQYYDIYDSSVPMDVFWHRSRSKKFKEMALSFNTLYWTEE